MRNFSSVSQVVKNFRLGVAAFPSSETGHVVINEGKGNCRRSDPWAREMEVLRRRPLRRLFSFSCFAFSWAGFVAIRGLRLLGLRFSCRSCTFLVRKRGR